MMWATAQPDEAVDRSCNKADSAGCNFPFVAIEREVNLIVNNRLPPIVFHAAKHFGVH